MPDVKVDLSTCPSCSLDPTFAMKTTDQAKLTTQNLVSQGTVRACIAPTTMEVDGDRQPALFIVFHKEEDPEFVSAADIAAEQGEADEVAEELAETTTGEGEGDTTEDELEEGGAEDEGEADASEASADDPNEDAPDASDALSVSGSPKEGRVDLDSLTTFERRVYEFVKKEGEAQLASIQGKFANTGRSPGEVEASVKQLVATDVLGEAGDEVYEVAA